MIVLSGVIAQEFADVIPEAVKSSGEVKLPNGKVIPNFLVVDKVCLSYAEKPSDSSRDQQLTYR